MIERVARELAAADNGAPTTWRLYEDDAKLAIKAMGRATDGMLAAGDCTRQNWTRMIEAALAGS